MIQFDVIGKWSEVKLEILRKYAKAYSKILARQANLEHFYIDGFSGAGLHVSKGTSQAIEGSPRIALGIEPPFRRYYFIDLNGDKLDVLRGAVGERSDVEIRQGDCNGVLVNEIFPQVTWERYRRALCLLDPYGLDLDWKVTLTAGELRTIDLFLNFPVMDMNRNALWRDPDKVSGEHRERMTRYWGDETWFDATYQRSKQLGLFGGEEEWIKVTNGEVAKAFRHRLRQVAGFAHVPEPLPMKNSKGVVVYYLFFGSAKPVAGNIVEDIFDRYR